MKRGQKEEQRAAASKWQSYAKLYCSSTIIMLKWKYLCCEAAVAAGKFTIENHSGFSG
jgi:hypothetical protein